jgi:UPF0716 family protein affecting phage T7 exclusion
MNTIGQARRLLKIVGGFTLLIVGTLLLVLPGPGLVTMAVGLALLAGEFVWARSLLNRVRSGAARVRNRFSQRGA